MKKEQFPSSSRKKRGKIFFSKKKPRYGSTQSPWPGLPSSTLPPRKQEQRASRPPFFLFKKKTTRRGEIDTVHLATGAIQRGPLPRLYN